MSDPQKALAVLIVEDVESDAQLIVRLLRKAGYELVYEQVETAEQMRAALENRRWDVVISDYKMPRFDGPAALKLLHETGRDIPFIVVSGTIGEETAVDMMKAGAHDYLLKGNLTRLVPAVERELGQSGMRRERRRMEEARVSSEAELRALFASMHDVVLVIDRQGIYRKIAPTNHRLLVSPPEELLGKSLGDVFPAEQAAFFIDAIRRVLETKQTTQIEYELMIDNQPTWFETFISPMDEEATLWVARDVTERKQAKDLLQQSQTNLLSALRVAHMGHWEFDVPTRVFTFNDQYYSLHGMTAREAGGYQMSAQTFAKKYVHPEDAPMVAASIQNAIEATDPGFQYQIEGRIMRVDGEPRWITVWFRIQKDAQGRTVKLYGVNQDITERKQAEEGIRHRIAQLEMLHQSGLALNQLLSPKEIGRKILELLEEKLNWHHTSLSLYNPQDDGLKLLDFNQPGLENEVEKSRIEARFNELIVHSTDGLTGWALRQSRVIRCGDVSKDPHYIETYPAIRSGLYAPMELGSRKIGIIGVESEQLDAFSEADEQLIVTLANQAAGALENARLFAETRQRVQELETLNQISLHLRSASKQNEMLSIVLDEALDILNTSHGVIELYNKAAGRFEKIAARGWTAQVVEPPQKADEGMVGKVFTSGELYISHEFATDPQTRHASRGQLPPGWGGVCLPIRASQQTLGVMVVSFPSGREPNKDEVRLLSILTEMTGAALQRMQLHEQTIRRLEQLNALRAVDQAISNSLDIHLTLNILLTQTVSQLEMDAADVVLFRAGTNMLELTASYGFRTFLATSVSLRDSFAGRAILEHQSMVTLDLNTADQNPRFGKFCREEGFARYWCVPLVVKGEVKGALEVYSRREFTPDAEWIEFLAAFAGQAAIGIDNIQLFENLQRANMDLSLAYDATIEGWSRALDLRDHETEGHTLRVTDLTLKLARAMRVGESQLTAIRRGALLHDIGKMGVPDAILHKNGELTDEEWKIMRRHPEFARDMLLPIAYLNDALNIPYGHHEKWDGTGYPQGLKENQIPLAARIFAVVDVWDALTNDRTYRKKWTKQKALEYLREQSGKHFDPRVVEVFLKDIEEA